MGLGQRQTAYTLADPGLRHVRNRINHSDTDEMREPCFAGDDG
jgi:hypothetical protein